MGLSKGDLFGSMSLLGMQVLGLSALLRMREGRLSRARFLLEHRVAFVGLSIFLLAGFLIPEPAFVWLCSLFVAATQAWNWSIDRRLLAAVQQG